MIVGGAVGGLLFILYPEVMFQNTGFAQQAAQACGKSPESIEGIGNSAGSDMMMP